MSQFWIPDDVRANFFHINTADSQSPGRIGQTVIACDVLQQGSTPRDSETVKHATVAFGGLSNDYPRQLLNTSELINIC